MSNQPPKLSFAFKPPTGLGSLGSKPGLKAAGGAKLGGSGFGSSIASGSKVKPAQSKAFSGFASDDDEDDNHTRTSTPGAGPSNPKSKPKATGMISKPPTTSNSRVPPSFSSSSTKPSIYDDPTPSAPSSSSSSTPASSMPAAPAHLAKTTTTSLSRSARLLQAEAMAIDRSVFEYDEVYDGILEAREKGREEKERDGEERKPKYIHSFLQSAQTRRLDRLRAEDKMTQLTRDKEALENPELEGKESFVTRGYVAQMEEVRRVEEEERGREEKDLLSKKGPGMTTFYSNMLEQSEVEHKAAIEATTGMEGKKAAPAGPSLAIRPPSTTAGTSSTPPAASAQAKMASAPAPKAAPKAPDQYDYDPEPESDTWLLREASTKRQAELLAAATTSTPVIEKLPGGVSTDGEKVEINDEGAIVDKRVLLKAGLNIMKKPIAPLPSLGSKAKAEAETRYQSRAVGASASYAERNARERERLAKMIKEEEDRERRRKDAEMKEAEEKARKRKLGGDQKEEGDLKRKAAKERFEERKRRKMEEDEEAARKAALEGGGTA